MKLHFVAGLLAAALCASLAVRAAESAVKNADVPAAVKDAVEKRYAGAKQLGWEMEVEEGKTRYEVKLEQGKDHLEVSVTSEGKVLSEESELAYSAVPEAVKKAFAAGKYGAWKVHKAEKIVDGQDAAKVSYEVAAKQGSEGVEVVFDASGKQLKEELSHGKAEKADEGSSGAAGSFIALPGGPPVSMDYLAYDAKNDRVWAPAGNTGKVFVLDVKSGKLAAIEGFETTQVKERDGNPRTVGPSSASAGDGFVYVGNRAGFQICAVDAKSLEKRGCVALPSSPDGTVWVGTTKEVWVTTPREDSITIVDAKDPLALKITGKIAVDGPEGYAVDEGRGLFYTNLEEKDKTLAFDVKTRKLVSTWESGCGKEGPRGLALDTERRHLFVACAIGKVRALDASKDGALLGEVDAGEGLDNIDYLQSKHRVYAAGGRAGTLTVAEADAKGALKKITSSKAALGGRVVVVDSSGTAYVADSKGGRLVVIKP